MPDKYDLILIDNETIIRNPNGTISAVSSGSGISKEYVDEGLSKKLDKSEINNYFKILSLNDIIKNKNLGELENNSGLTIMNKVRELNSYVSIAFVEINNISGTSADLIGFQIYKDSVKVNFSIKEVKQNQSFMYEKNRRNN